MYRELNLLSQEELATKIEETTKEIENIQLEQKAIDRSYLFGAIIVLVLVLGLSQPSSGILFVLAVIYVFIPKENESKLANRLSDLQYHLYELQKVYRNKS